ncbi:glycosyltransferase family 4 protein [Bryobacter aggregatus]|uniref:glycosyltransferase family 4 protein n=1 Tax=Bryobacter aggregatus TaxID=360054 RepID=UPI00138E0249|nr:glycosyltransferase [Bryobacter aggregatus]
MPAKSIPSSLNVVIDQRLKRTPDGRVWTHTPPSYEFFEPALRVFDRVRVIARTIEVFEIPHQARLVNGPHLRVLPIPNFMGPLQYFCRRGEVRDSLKAISLLDGPFLLRIPSKTAFELAELLDAAGRPYATEMLTDPFDFFAPGVAPSGLARCFRPYFCRRSRELCARAVAANYITGSATRRANPAPNAEWAGSVSDVDLSAEAFVGPAEFPATGPIEIVTVGFLDLLYKGQDILIRALSRCHAMGLDFRLTFVGEGKRKAALLELARSCGIGDRVSITGALGGTAAVREYLQRAHLFTLPSRAEGIPRALLEAMAASLPAIATHVGAIPDLLDPQWIIPPGSVEALQEKLMQFAALRKQWSSIGHRNQTVARNFDRDLLEPLRLEFYRAILRQGLASQDALGHQVSDAA